MAFDLAAAKQAGYSDQEIADYLKFDVAGARKAGYSDQEIAAHLGNTAPLAAPNNQPADNSFGRQLGLTARAGYDALGAIPHLIADPVVRGINALTGSNLSIPSEAYQRTLDSFLPAPANATERFSNTVASSMAQPAMIGAAVPKLAARMGLQTLAAGTGAASSDAAREAGLGTWPQIGAGLAGGVVAPTAVAAGAAAGRGTWRLLSGLGSTATQAGRENAVARILQRSASNPAEARQSILSAQNYVPGVNPATAELANDSGISALSKALRNQNPGVFSDLEAANDAARQDFLRRKFGAQSDLEAARAQREAQTRDIRESSLGAANQTGTTVNDLTRAIQQKVQSKVGALQDAGQLQTGAAEQQTFADSFTPVPGMPRVPAALSPNLERVPEYSAGAQEAQALAAKREAERQTLTAALQAVPYTPLKVAPLVDSIGQTLNTPGKRASDVVTKTLSAVQGKLASLADQNGLIDSRDLYTVRKEIGNTIETYAKESSNWDKRLTSGLEGDLQRKFDAAIVNAGGTEWPQYLRRYSDLSKRIEGMQLGQEIYGGAVNPLTDRLSPAAFARQMSNRAPDVAGAGAATSDALSRVNLDLKRSVMPTTSTRTMGSDTLQNLVGNQVLERALGHLPGGLTTRVASKAASFVFSPFEQKMRDLLLQSVLDPQMGAGLLGRQLKAQPDLTGGLLSKLLPISYGGLLGTMGAQ